MSGRSWDLISLDEIDSTNAFAAREILAGRSSPFWCIAARQTAGVGRRGRSWMGGKDNFFASAAFWPKCSIDFFAQYSFVAALALHDAFSQVTQRADLFSLKWPNDVLGKDLKIAGILLQTVQHEGKTGLIVGIGVNLVTIPESKDTAHMIAPSSVAQVCGVTIGPIEFLKVLARTFEARASDLEIRDFRQTRLAWLSVASGLGSPIIARLPDGTHEGIFEDIDQDGALILRKGQERMVISAGDVYFGPNT